MKYEFTAGARRAIGEAAGWSCRGVCYELEAPALLVGLLAESECRAALMLGRHGVDVPAVCRRWPALERVEGRGATRQHPARAGGCDPQPPIPPFSAELEESVAALLARMPELRGPLELATEHLLLGLAAAEHDLAVWLRAAGVDPNDLEQEIRGRYVAPLPEGPQYLSLPPDRAPPERPEPSKTPPSSAEEPIARTVARMSGEARSHEEGGQGQAVPPDVSPLSPQGHVRALRVLDAALNRAREGLRVVEDYVRFVLDDAHLTGQMKRLRHDLAAATARVPIGRRLAARETEADVGTGVSVASERRREDLEGVLGANFTRLEESLRTLEEFGKILDPPFAAELEQLRYRTYTLQRAVQITSESLDRLGCAALYVLIDGGPSEEEFAALGRSLVDARVHVVQLRDKRLDDRRLLARARLLRRLTDRSDTLFVMNDRADLAALAQADGVHVGQEELTVKDARTLVGPDALVGVSTHSIEQARQAVLDGASYVGVGPVFPSGTKRFEEFPGVELLRAVAEEIRLPAFAIGGITRHNLPEVLRAGFRRVAVGAAITGAPDPAAAARDLLAALKEVER
jgi:thiamine-phosphate pyrophosphorylase